MLVLIRDNDAPHGQQNIAKMLLGHDERQLFIAAVPSNTRGVLDAKDKLKPAAVRQAEQRKGVKRSKKNKHRNEARLRQGDWFFVPVPDPSFIDEKMARKNQPLRRGGRGNAHMLEEVVEVGGQAGYERGGHFITEQQYFRMDDEKKIGYRQTTRNATIYVRGKVRHPEHKTIKLNGWHQVIPNTETTARRFDGRLTLRGIGYTD